MNSSIQWMLACSLILADTTYGLEQPRNDSSSVALSAAEQLKRLDQDYQKAEQAVGLALQKAKTDEERKKTIYTSPTSTWIDPFLVRALELARSHPNDPAAVDALIWRVMHANLDAGVDECVRLLRVKYVESEKLVELFRSDGFIVADSKQVEPLLREAIAKNPHRSVRGQACFSLAAFLRDQARYAGRETLPDTVEALFEKVIAEFGDLPNGDNRTLADAARVNLLEIRDLAVGKIAPEIEGEDVDGKKFKLSDYRGKIVVIGFWGDWCGPCRALYPHERSLVKRMDGKPFALLGVNSDPKQRLKKAITREQMTWTSWWDGGSNWGPIARAWNVTGWPALYVLDQKGVIRYKLVDPKNLDEVVDKLVGAIDK